MKYNFCKYEFIYSPHLKIRGIFEDSSRGKECHMIVFDNNRGEIAAELLFGDLMEAIREKSIGTISSEIVAVTYLIDDARAAGDWLEDSRLRKELIKLMKAQNDD